MGVEIERKFLLANEDWKNNADEGTVIRQGYLNSHAERTVRVRIYGDHGFLTIKGKSVKTTRLEFEYEIPLAEASQLLQLCEQPIIEKTRFTVLHQGDLWEIDEFEGLNKGLVVAEIELQEEEQTIEIPSWIGQEVSSETKYFNSNLIKHPFGEWR